MKHKLKPLQKTNEVVCSATKVCVVDVRKFLEGMRCEHMCFSIIPKNGKEEVEKVPTIVTYLLEECLDNVPNGLPLVQRISH